MSSPPDSKGYLSSLSSYSPWASRSVTPKPSQPKDNGTKNMETGHGAQRGGDHTVSNRHRLSLRSYPHDCPPLNVQWYHAVDLPKRKPHLTNQTPSGADTAATEPKKYIPFSVGDSKAIELAFQKLSDRDDDNDREKLLRGPYFETDDVRAAGDRLGIKLRQNGEEHDRLVKVPVNEDYLFDVDVEHRELAPAYWLGPVYDVRRGTWFFQEGSNLRPCDENLATQLEEGYLKLKPWRFPRTLGHQRSSSQPKARPTSLRIGEDPNNTSKPRSSSLTRQSSGEELKMPPKTKTFATKDKMEDSLSPEAIPRAFHLFGTHMNSAVTYEDDVTAWLVTDDFLSRMSSTVYERFAGGAHFAGTKIVRGYSDLSKKSDPKDEKNSTQGSPRVGPLFDSNTANDTEKQESGAEPPSPSETRRQTLERQMSSLVESASLADREKQEEEIRRREEQEIQDDYKDQDGDEQGREIEHLILATHGIGQRLGLRMESVNFVHDVNTLRKTLKAVYNGSGDLQALNGELGNPTKNCRMQVLPICWRHLLDFPKQSLKHNRREHDLGDADFQDDEYPNLDDITVDGVPAVRSLITDLALDILLYQSPAYKGHITKIVLDEMNRIYKLFKQRNPNFNGKISLIGHSLGSAVLFDILCNQKVDRLAKSDGGRHQFKDNQRIQLDFVVEDFYALGSPIGLFQMLKGRTIAARKTLNVKPAQTPFDTMDDPFLAPASFTTNTVTDDSGYVGITTSSPKCQRLFNIFHPTDPISYRLEPLISPAMAALKPQPLPYTKKGIFGAPVGQGLTGIGARVGQSVSGLWTSFSSGIASSLLNRSLGISGEDAGKFGSPAPGQQSRVQFAAGAGANISSGGVIPQTATLPHDTEQLARGNLDVDKGEDGKHPPTLLDSEIETLFSGFQKRKRSYSNEGDTMQLGEQPERREIEEQMRRLRREEGKVRALNANGRVDYSIQEGAFDISLLASIASHLSYWADEDVSHFMISQLLSRHRVLRGVKSGQDHGAQ